MIYMTFLNKFTLHWLLRLWGVYMVITINWDFQRILICWLSSRNSTTIKTLALTWRMLCVSTMPETCMKRKSSERKCGIQTTIASQIIRRIPEAGRNAFVETTNCDANCDSQRPGKNANIREIVNPTVIPTCGNPDEIFTRRSIDFELSLNCLWIIQKKSLWQEKWVASIDGSNATKNTTNVLSQLFSLDLRRRFNWSGIGKHGFHGLRIQEIITSMPGDAILLD